MSELSIMDPNSDTPAMEVKNVSKTFSAGKSVVRALEDVSFNVYEGQVTGLIGPDAAGKTTLMRLVVGLLTSDSGRISVLGKDAATQSLDVQAAVGYMPQRFGLYEDLTVRENLNLYADLQGVPPQGRSHRYQELMAMTGISPFMDRLAGRLSGGMKQKLGLACTLVRAPRLLLLDEPTVGVDPVSRRELWNIVYRLVQEEGMTVLLSTAYLDEAEKCAAIVLLHRGRVLGQGTPGDFKRQVQGRTYFAQVAGMKRRFLQEKLSEAPEVLDAVIQGDSVRLVLRSSSADAVANVSAAVPRTSLTPVPPRFEDGFMALLQTRKVDGNPVSKSAQPPTGRRQEPYDPQKPVIEVHELKRRFGAFYAVKGISFQVFSGEIFGLLGANGAGKSTTFRMLCGLLPASAGTLRVAGVDLRHAAATARLSIGYMSQKFSLYGDLSVAQNLRFFSSAYGLAGQRRSERLTWALEQFGLADLADTTSRDLSLGYKQRLAMACALMHEPDILFLDEPTSGVDPLARREFWRRINVLAEQGVTIMVTTHFMEEAEYCDRLAIMASGRILTIGTPDEIRRAARSAANAAPTIEDAFIHLIEADQAEAVAS
jgi:ABC-2 type transport system ATP-binding protein